MPEPTPGQTVGPFFHYALPYERGSELVPPAMPGAVRLHGTVFDGAGVPVPDALVEIRQADAEGRVPAIEGSLARDGEFTGWGRAATDASGYYSFVTIEPPRFFAVVVFAPGLLDRLFTRAYVPGSADTFVDGLAEADRDAVTAKREDDGNLRFDIRLQGEHETVFLEFR